MIDTPEWIVWAGGKNPVPDKWVEYQLRGFDGAYSEASDALHWGHSGRGDDIIAYRVVEAAKS
jgi:hypothetical protein